MRAQSASTTQAIGTRSTRSNSLEPSAQLRSEPVRPSPLLEAVSQPPRYDSASLTPGDRQLVKVFKALSDRTRQRILHLLEERQRNVGEIVNEFPLSQPTISRHLAVLKEANLVSDRRHGQNVIYSLNEQALTASMQRFFGRFSSCQRTMR